MQSLTQKFSTCKCDMCPFQCEHIYYNPSTRDMCPVQCERIYYNIYRLIYKGYLKKNDVKLYFINKG